MSKRAVAIAAVLALVPALWFGARQVFGDSADGTTGPRTELPIPPVTTPAATPTVPATTPAAPTTTPNKPAPPTLPRVAADVPRRLLSKGLLDVGFDDSVEPRNGLFRAASSAEAARWGSRGKPGSPSNDTVYLIGKSYTKGVSAFDTLPRIRLGAKIVIRTDSGDLTYTVRTAGSRAASGLAKNAGFAAKTPGRLVLVGIGYDRSGAPTGKVFVVTAQLSAAVPR